MFSRTPSAAWPKPRLSQARGFSVDRPSSPGPKRLKGGETRDAGRFATNEMQQRAQRGLVRRVRGFGGLKRLRIVRFERISLGFRVLVASPSPPRSAPYFHLWAIQLPFLYSYYLGSRDVGRNPKDSTLSTLTSDRLKYHTSVRVQTTRVLHPSIGFNT